MQSSAVPSIRQYAHLLRHYLHPVRLSAAQMGGLILLSIALQLALPLVMRRFIDDVMAGAQTPWLLRLGVLYLIAAVIQQFINLIATYLAENVGWSATNELRADLTGHLLRLDQSFHNAHSPGEMIERIDGDVTNLANFFSRFMIQVFGNLLLLIGVVILLSAVDIRVGLTIAGFIAITLLLLWKTRNLAVPYWKAERQASAELFGFMEERLSGVEDVRANGGGTYVMNRFYTLMRALLHRSLQAALMINVFLNTSLFMFAIGNAAALAVGAYLFEGQVISLGTVYIIFQYTVLLQRPLEEISRQMQDFQRAGAGLARVNELLKIHSALDLPPASSHRSPPHHELAAVIDSHMVSAAYGVRFEGVTFSYPDSVPAPAPIQPELDAASSSAGISTPPPTLGEVALHDLTFTLEPGMVLGLLGRTGSGKTSLTRLLFRLYDPQSGAVETRLADGSWRNLRDLPLTAWRACVGMIPQNVQIFNTSVRDNLTFFAPQCDDLLLSQALNDVGLGDWLGQLPEGLDTKMEAGGAGLSAGQAQLLAFARIFLRQPQLVILDEASSRLDPAGEARVQSAIDGLVQGRTAVIVAHRLGTVQRASHIMILDAGRVIEFGSRASLASNPLSHFNRLLKTGLEEVLA